TGVLIDSDALYAYGEMLAERIDMSEGKIYELAGETFNIGSPKQLGAVLFEKLGLPAPKKTKTGYSTAVDVLDKLEDRHPVIKEIKEYRELTKLKATYADGRAKVIAPDGRIHTNFQMTATATGRLSSTEPNLQNIPIRRELGSERRSMFIAAPGCVLVDADYSQIELRLLAHIADDEAMLEAFKSGVDIHTVTAASVFGAEPGEVTPLMRSRAKAVNFGIVYGISAFSLSQDIGVTTGEAKVYIDSYFERFPGVRRYMTEIVERAKADGFVTTLFGRRRYIPELISKDHNVRSFGERVALNMPIQGTAADIMKIAMVSAAKALKNESPRSKLVLQIHDELIIEAPESEAEAVAELLKREMEGAAQLRVPLTATAQWGKSWSAAK
ncbi:MAG: DNA polymerase I, partial [Clostridiales bacterium]|nr:DNA polymerase I [Clostridiales bacterium]